MARDPDGHLHGGGHLRRDRKSGRGRRLGRAPSALPRASPSSTATASWDTPLSESAFIGAAIGAACSGLRPVAELMFVDFMGVCFDEIFNQADEVPVHVRRQGGDPRWSSAAWRGPGSGPPPSTPRCSPRSSRTFGAQGGVPVERLRREGLLIQSIRDNDPVIFFEHKNLYDTKPTCRRASTRSRSRRRTWSARVTTPHRDLRADGAAIPRRGRRPREGRHRVRGHRPSHPLPDRHGHGSGERGEHRAARVRGRGEPALLDRGGRLRHGDPGDLRCAQGRGADGDRATQRRCRSPPRSRDLYIPGADRIAAAVRQTVAN